MKAAAALLLSGGVAVAQPAMRPGPLLQPSRDVTVLYRVDGGATKLVPGGLERPVKLYWDAGGERLRAELEGRSQVALIDLRSHVGQVIDTALRVALPLRIRTEDLQVLSMEGARLTPRGHAVLAGLGCTQYRVETGRAPGSACITADGVPLQGEGEVQGRPGRFTAVSVSYGPLSPGLFTVPAGYMALGVGGLDTGTLNGLRNLGSSLLGRDR